MTARIVVFGATGYTGGLVAEALVRLGVRPVLAGARPDAVRAVADRLGALEHAVARADDPDALRALVCPGDVLVTTVGPFERLGHEVVAAAVARGAHYLDSTGEIGFVRAVRDRHDDAARRAGSAVLPAMGYDYVPGLLAGALACAEAGDAVHAVDVGYFVDGARSRGRRFSHGTRATIVDGLLLPMTVLEHGRPVERRPAASVRTFRTGGRSRPAVLAGGSEVLFLPETVPTVQSVTVFNGWFGPLSRAAQVVPPVLQALACSGAGRRVIAAARERIAGPPGGPDATERARVRTRAIAVALDASGRELASVELRGPGPYDLTAELMAWAAQRLTTVGASATGVIGPVSAFGLDDLTAACAAIGLTRST